MLYLLQSFDTVCKKHDIDYWLDYGTLLGAIRHQGFIPWDTDTDVGMLRSDYALFLDKGVPELPQDIFFQTPETEPAMAPWSWLVEARLRDRHSRYVPDKRLRPSRCSSVDYSWIFSFMIGMVSIRMLCRTVLSGI